MTVRWTFTTKNTYVQYTAQKKRIKNRKEYHNNSFFLRIIHEYFQPKNGRKIRIFSLSRKNNILLVKRGYLSNLEGPGEKTLMKAF